MLDKLYCFVDETGQDTKGRLFLVAIILKEMKDLAELEKGLYVAEEKSGKKKLKWKKTNKFVKKKYLHELLLLRRLKNSVYFSQFLASKEYTRLTALTIAKAVLAYQKQQYSVTVITDGLNQAERNIIRDELKKLHIKYRKIRGLKDEQDVFLRTADAMAGFLRDYYEGQIYAEEFFKRFTKKNLVKEV